MSVRSKRTIRSAFSLIEALVAAVLFAAVVALVLGGYGQGARNSVHLDAALEATQMAYLVRSRLADDLASHMPVPSGRAVSVEGSALELLRVEEADGTGVAGTCLDESLRPRTKKVVYRFDGRTGRLLRNGVAVAAGRFRKVVFRHLPCDLARKRGETLEVGLFPVGVGKQVDGKDSEFRLILHCPHTTLDRVYDEFCE